MKPGYLGEELELVDGELRPARGKPALKFNENHVPAGSPDGGQFTFAYHGAASSVVDKVLKEGLHVGDSWYGRPGAVYLSKKPPVAEMYAFDRALLVDRDTVGKEGLNAVVFKVKAPKDALPDERQTPLGSSVFVEHNIDPEDIVSYRTYHIAQGEDWPEISSGSEDILKKLHAFMEKHASKWHEVVHAKKDGDQYAYLAIMWHGDALQYFKL